MTEVIINVINKSYPPVSSAIKNVPVNGACITPLINPAIPANAKFAYGILKPIRLNPSATIYPVKHPINKLGANIPPVPPAPFVAVVATILNSTINDRYSNIAQCSVRKL